MTDKLKEALDRVNTTYQDLVEIAESIVKNDFQQVDSIVTWVTNNGNAMSIDQLRDVLLHLQLCAYNISEIKEKSSFKADLSDAILKEQFAIHFNSEEGSAAVKEKFAIISCSEETISKVLYSLVADMYKNKVDQIHRLVSALSSVLMSRMQEAKFMNLGSTSEIPSTTNGTINLNNLK